MIYECTVNCNGDATWTAIRGTECHEGVVSNIGNIILDAGSGFDLQDWREKAWRIQNGLLDVKALWDLPPRGEAKTCETVPCPASSAPPAPPKGGGWIAPAEVMYKNNTPIANTWETAVYLPDWREEARQSMMKVDTKNEPKESTLFDKDAIVEAYEFLGDMKREAQVEEILNLIMAWGEDKYAPKTVFRFDKAFKAASVTGAYSVACTPPQVYSYAAIKAENGKWYITGNNGFYPDWEAFVKFLVTEGEPVDKDDVEIFPPAVFPADSDESIVQ